LSISVNPAPYQIKQGRSR